MHAAACFSLRIAPDRCRLQPSAHFNDLYGCAAAACFSLRRAGSLQIAAISSLQRPLRMRRSRMLQLAQGRIVADCSHQLTSTTFTDAPQPHASACALCRIAADCNKAHDRSTLHNCRCGGCFFPRLPSALTLSLSLPPDARGGRDLRAKRTEGWGCRQRSRQNKATPTPNPSPSLRRGRGILCYRKL